MRKFLIGLFALIISAPAAHAQATVVLTFDYYTSAYDDAVGILNPRGLPATWFVQPSTVAQSGGPSLNSMVLLQQLGWEIGIYSGQNMVTALSNNRVTAKQHIAEQKAAMLLSGFDAKSYAPNQRAWNGSLANITRDHFENVRVAANAPWQSYPIPDRAYVDKGGTCSLSSINNPPCTADTGASLCSTLNTVIAAGNVAWFVVIHKVGVTADSLTILASEFTTFADCLATARNAGQIRVPTFQQAMTP